MKILMGLLLLTVQAEAVEAPGVRICDVSLSGNDSYVSAASTGGGPATTVVLAWPRVTEDSGTVKGYSVEKASVLRGGWEKRAFIYSTATVRSYSEPVESGHSTYMRVKTVLWDTQESSGSVIVEIPDEATAGPKVPNYYYMSDDENAWVKIPGKVMNEIYTSTQSAPLSIAVRKETNPNFLMAYNISVSGASTNAAKEFKSGDKNGVKMSISYDQLSGGAAPLAAARTLALYWFNGVEWIRIGGEMDVVSREVYTYSRTLGRFAVQFAPLAEGFTLTKVAPRIFSPDEPSTVINRAVFTYENPGNVEVTIRIFDITGALVRRNLAVDTSTAMSWDGRDQSGGAVKGGIYIYQIEAGDKILSGTVVVAK
jgi:hypothetical protein